MEQGTTRSPPGLLANQNSSLSTKGKVLPSLPKRNLKQATTTGTSLNLLPKHSASAQVAGRPRYFQANRLLISQTTLGCWRPLWATRYIAFSSSSGSLSPHFRFNCPKGGRSSENRQDGPARSYPPSCLQHRREAGGGGGGGPRGACQQSAVDFWSTRKTAATALL